MCKHMGKRCNICKLIRIITKLRIKALSSIGIDGLVINSTIFIASNQGDMYFDKFSFNETVSNTNYFEKQQSTLTN